MRLAAYCGVATGALLLLFANLYGRPVRHAAAAPRRRRNYYFVVVTTTTISTTSSCGHIPLQLAHAAPPKPWVSPWVQHVPERGGYTFWSTDFHIAPIADVRDVFRSLCDAHGLCHTVEEHSFSGACAKTFGGRASSCAPGCA